jgi:hypothetical protein
MFRDMMLTIGYFAESSAPNVQECAHRMIATIRSD